MACLIIATVWIFIRFFSQCICKLAGINPTSNWSVFSWFLWLIGWLGNIALLIIGMCIV